MDTAAQGVDASNLAAMAEDSKHHNTTNLELLASPPPASVQVKDFATRTILTPTSALSPWSVLVLGIPRSSFTSQRLQSLAEGIVRSFEFVPKRDQLVTLVHVSPGPDGEELALIGFDSELVAELFLDTCAEFPLRVEGAVLSVVRNFSSSSGGDLREVMRRSLNTSGFIMERHIVYVSERPETWVDSEKLGEFFAGMVCDLPRDEVVKSVRVLPGVSAAYVELVSDVAADLIFYRSRKSGILSRISGGVIICRGREAIPMFQSSRKFLKEMSLPLPKVSNSGGRECSMDLGTPIKQLENVLVQEDQEHQSSQQVMKTEKVDDEHLVKQMVGVTLNPPENLKTEKDPTPTPTVVQRTPAAAGTRVSTIKVAPKVEEFSSQTPAPVDAAAAVNTRRKAPAPRDPRPSSRSMSPTPPRTTTRVPRFESQKFDDQLYISRMRGYDPDRLKFVLQTLLRKLNPDVSMHQIRISWWEGNSWAVAEFLTRNGANQLMAAYVRYPHEVCISDFPLCIYRHKYYVRPGSSKQETSPKVSDYLYITGIPDDLDDVPARGALTELFEKTLAKSSMLRSNAGFKFFADFYEYSPGVYKARFYSSLVCSSLLSLNTQFEIGGKPISLVRKDDFPVLRRIQPVEYSDNRSDDERNLKRQSMGGEDRVVKRGRIGYT